MSLVQLLVVAVVVNAVVAATALGMTHVVLLLPSESDPVRGCEGWSFYRSVNLGVGDGRG